MSFDVASYAMTAGAVRVDDIDGLADGTAFVDRPLAPEALRCLRYMHDVESHTVCYLRDLLLTPSHQDSDVTTFLTMWNYEEHWHGEAIGQVLRAHGELGGAPRVAAVRRANSRASLPGLVGPLVSASGAVAAGDDFVAVHMSWGALNEWTTFEGYRRLAALAGHPTLDELLRRIMRQETRHVAFYVSQARERLATSSRARALTRWALRKRWRPVGSGVVPAAETRFVLRYLLAGEPGARAAARIDAYVDSLPGLGGLGLLAGVRARALAGGST